jgi:predicted AlkP superfamily pyrophosphatase or phosphodiesterase
MKYLLTIFLLSSLFSAIAQKPKLVVGIVVDQMCFDYLYRFNSKFSKNGFKKMMENGTNCLNVHYNYIPTYTGPGHASIYTGTTPKNHGIHANDWYDRTSHKMMNCVEDSMVSSIGTVSKEGIFSCKRLKANTITDQLRFTNPDSKVFSISLKNRGAILPGGHMSNGSFWFDISTGKMISSSYYFQKLPNWLEKFNEKENASTYFKNSWNTLYPISNYTESTQDDSPYEDPIFQKKTPVFPYSFSELKTNIEKTKAFTYTPFANTYLVNLSIETLKNEKLGQSSSTDFLTLSFSSTDILGHAYGPNSVEIEDMYLRLDQELARLITYLEETIDDQNFVLFLTADHAVVPVPQQLIDNKLPGGYVPIKEYLSNVKTEVKNKFGFDFIEKVCNNNIYFNRKLLIENKIPNEIAEEFVANYLLSLKHIKNTYTSTNLKQNISGDKWKNLVQEGFNTYENGDVLYIYEAGYLEEEDEHTGTTHGTGYNYDTHVPLLWYGKSIPKQEIHRKIDITDITPTLSQLLYISMPNYCTGNVIEEIFNQKK